MTTIDHMLLSQASQLQALTAINTQDFLAAFGMDNLRRGRKALDTLCWLPARRFARQMVQYDHLVGELGLRTASQRILKDYVQRLEIEGQQNIPADGPLLVLSNHPGMTDSLVLFASIVPRQSSHRSCPAPFPGIAAQHLPAADLRPRAGWATHGGGTHCGQPPARRRRYPHLPCRADRA